MNFEQLVESREKRNTSKVRMPYGFFTKRLFNGRFSNFVEFHDELTDSLSFTKGVKEESEATSKISNRHQLHFTLNQGEEHQDVFAIALETGNYTTMELLLNDNPAIVAKTDFINQTIRDLMEITMLLNERKIYHLCFAPSNVLVRMTDYSTYLLHHGSFYLKVDQDFLWEGIEDFVAPEVLSEKRADDRSDVYALGKFICWIYETSGMPFGLQKLVNKAIDANPEERYATVADFYNVLNHYFSARKTGVAAAVALGIALAIVGLFFYLLPQPEVVEYVKPVEEPIPDEMIDDDLLLGIGADADSATIARIVAGEMHRKDSMEVDEREMRMFNAKAEAIFRKQFAKAADEILSKVYNKDKMSMTEKDFLVKSKAMTEELAKKQEELSKATNLDGARSQHIASDIIDQLTDKKMKQLDKDYMGIRQKKDEIDDELKKAKAESKDNKQK